MSRTSAPKTISVGSRTISFKEAGLGEPVLMLHGGGPGASGMSNYVRNVDALAETFRVIVPDMPGYGASTKGLNQKDVFGDLAQSMVGFLDALGIDSAHIIGNSLGGACAIRMALDAPKRVKRLVLMGPGGIGTTRAAPTKGLSKLIGYYKGDPPSLAKLREFLTYLVYDPSQLSDDLAKARFESSIDPEVVASPPLQGPKSLGAALRMDFTRDRRLASLHHSTLVLWGADDKVNRASGGRQLVKLIPNGDLFEFSKTGHWVQWERAAEFNAITKAFLSAERTV